MVPQFLALIADAMAELEKEPNGREKALVKTKLDEAVMWFNALQRAKFEPKG